MRTLHQLPHLLVVIAALLPRAMGGNQHPVMKGELEGVLPLVKVK